MTSVLVSVPASTSLRLEWPPQIRATVEERRERWGAPRAERALRGTVEAIRAAFRARRHDALVLCTAGFETLVVAAAMRVVAPRTRLVVYDHLLSSSWSRLPGGLVRTVLGRVDRWLVIRRGDAATFATRYGVPADRCAFVPFPAPRVPAPATATANAHPDRPYVYAGGLVHRDYATLMSALALLDGDVHLVVGAHASAVHVPARVADRVSFVPDLSPESGAAHLARARVVVLALADTELPCGPLVMLDALAAGAAIVATDVNGNRDYCAHGLDALVVPPGDARAMAEAVGRLWRDAALRARLGMAARARADALTPSAVADLVAHEIESVVRDGEPVGSP